MKRFLLVGGGGTIGYYFERMLTKQGLVPFVANHGRKAGDNYIRTDIMYVDDVRKAIRSSNADCIIHLAAEVSRRGSETNLAKTMSVNVVGTLNVGIAAIEANVPVVYTSTSEVYGRTFGPTTAVTEDMTPDPFNNMYGLSKYQGEQTLEYLARRHELRASIARIFMTYGEGKVPRTKQTLEGIYTAMGIMIVGLMHGQPIDVHIGTARQWCHIDDTCRGLLMMAQKAPSILNGGRPPNIYNLGFEPLYTSRYLAETIADILGADRALIRDVPCPSDTIPVKIASFEKIRRELGFEAHIALKDGIRSYIDWMRLRVKDDDSLLL